jgi:hypothetical protein
MGMPEPTADAAMPERPTVLQLKKRALELAKLPRNSGWLELSQLLASLHRHPDEGKAQFRGLIEDGTLRQRAAYYLLEVGQLIRSGDLSAADAERIGWTKLQIIGSRINGMGAAKLLKVARDNSVQELKRQIAGEGRRRKRRVRKPHCMLLYFTAAQYRRLERAMLANGAERVGQRRGLVRKEEAIMQIVREAT